jgi:O-antigen ligase
MRDPDIAGTILRPGGTMGHSSNFAKLASLCLPMCLAILYAVYKNIWRITICVIIIASLSALVFTASRAGIATSLFGLVWVFLMKRLTMKQKKTINIPIVFFLVLGIGLAWQLGGNLLKSRMTEDYGSAISRPQMFSVAYNVIKNHPFLGVGLNNYTLIASYYDKTREAISITFPHPVHNIYLLYAAEMGIAGALFFVWFLVATIFLAFKLSSQAKLSLDSAILKAIGIGITCSWLQGLTGYGFRSSIVHTSYLAIFAGALAAIKYYNQNHSADNNHL